jgi:hypothetical protein
MRASVCHHLHVPPKGKEKVLLVAPHHYNLKALEHSKQRVTLLTKAEAKKLDERLIEDCNMASKLLPPEIIEDLKGQRKTADLQKFIQAPNIPRKEVQDFIDSQERKDAALRRERQQERMWQQPPSPAPALKHKPPGMRSILTTVDTVIQDMQARFLYLQSQEMDPSSKFLHNKIVGNSLCCWSY